MTDPDGREVGSLPSGRPVGEPMSPAQAAQWAQVSRRSIMRAIQTQELQARRDNKNRWKIDPEDLDKWARAQWAPSGHAQSDAPTLPSQDALDLAAARAEIGQLRERLDDADRERSRERAEHLEHLAGIERERDRERDQYRDRIAATEQDRDHWREMAERRRWRWPWQR